jgi:hypothetical protein
MIRRIIMNILSAIRTVVEHMKTWCLQNFATKKQVEDLEIEGGGDVSIDKTELDQMLYDEMPLDEEVTVTIEAYFQQQGYPLYVSTKKPVDYSAAEADKTLSFYAYDETLGYSKVQDFITVTTGGTLYFWNTSGSRMSIQNYENETLYAGEDYISVQMYQYDNIVSSQSVTVTIES